MRRPARLTLAAVVVFSAIACGKKGPPLPPLVKLPAAPGDFTAVRRGSQVDLQFTVPAANTDGSRPANVQRIDVYAYTGAANLSDDQVVKYATKVGSVAVKAPRDPNLTADADEPEEETEAPQGSGLDQGATARLDDTLGGAALAPIDLPQHGRKPPADERERALVGPPPTPPVRQYVAVGFSTRGRRGALSKRVGVPLIEPPPSPSDAKMKYDESRIQVTWTPPARVAPSEPATDGATTLPSHPIGSSAAEIGYNVYEVTPSGAETRLTKAPIADASFTDTRMTWGVERCYVVRTVETVGGVSVESDGAAAPCRKLVDTFPPAAPKDLHAVAGEGTINLIWAPNEDKDLAGYIVLRGTAPDGPLEPLTPKPIADARFTDTVRAGVTYSYAVKAVDKAGNASALSNRVDEAAR